MSTFHAPARSEAAEAGAGIEDPAVGAAAVDVVLVADLDRSGVLRFLIGESELAVGKLGRLDLGTEQCVRNPGVGG